MLHQRHRSKWEALAVLALASALGCSKAAPLPESADACGRCHSSPSSPVPFSTPRGVSDPADRGAGAHSAHLATGNIREALSCGDCHKVPAKVSDPDHIGVGHAKVQFGELARTGGLAPSWDGTALRCSNTWCHGGGLKTANLFSPVWIEGAEMRCNSCHGAPPPLPHPQRTDCSGCHGRTVKPDGTIDIEGGLHIDGIVQAPTGDCTACHGDPARPAFSAAPPSGTRGEKDTTARAVGAHQSHLLAGRLRASIPCSECHVVPTDLSHVDGTPTVTFGALARSDGANTSWNSAATSCTVYCHGSTLPGGTNTTPQWTRVDGTQAACGTCHGLPPPSPHPQKSNCNSCHPGTVNPDGSLNAGGGLHINGVVDVEGLTCTSCHGSGSNPAPPLGTLGETATTDRAVGAHQSHLNAGPFARALECGECHVVPARIPHANGTVDINFGPLATTGGAAPRWTGLSCSSAYCHGSFAGGNAGNAPQWTRVDGTQAACGTCHGLPPNTGHHQFHVVEKRIGCGTCHTGYSATAVNISLHVNGRKDVDLAVTGWNATNRSCSNRCHGTERW
jgi:predicted CxxxxCH...CXXCH cytochrome family protein